jgi:hypothetical protein
MIKTIHKLTRSRQLATRTAIKIQTQTHYGNKTIVWEFLKEIFQEDFVTELDWDRKDNLYHLGKLVTFKTLS